MPKTTRTKKSTTTSNPISSRTRQAATNLLTMNNSSSGSSRRITNTSSGSSRRTNNTSSGSSRRTTNTSSGSSRRPPNVLNRHFIPMKTNISIWSFPSTPHSYRHIRLTSKLSLTIATYLDKLEKDKKDKKPIKVGDTFMSLDPLNRNTEIKVVQLSNDGKTCTVTKNDITKVFCYESKGSISYKKMLYEELKSKETKISTSIETLKNQMFYRRSKHTMKMFMDDYGSELIFFKKA